MGIRKVNRGGLFVISDEAYRFFVTLELATRGKLPHHLLATATSTLTSSPSHEAADVSAIVKSICEDDDVLFYWTFVGIDMDEEDADINLELLQYIVHLWINIRGFTYFSRPPYTYNTIACMLSIIIIVTYLW